MSFKQGDNLPMNEDELKRINREKMRKWRSRLENSLHETEMRHAREERKPGEKAMALKNWRSKNPEKARNATKRHHDKHREEINEYARAYYASNSDIIKEKHKNNSKKTQKNILPRFRSITKNPEKILAICRTRRARKKAAVCTLTAEQ